MFPEDFFDDGAVVALISGRFLPIDEMEVTKDVNTSSVRSINGRTSAVAISSTEWSISFTTRRDPMLQPPMMAEGYIFNNSHRIHLSDAISTSGGMEVEGWSNIYEVEMVIDSWEIEPR